MSTDTTITPMEEEALVHLCNMFETIDFSVLLDIVRKNDCDVDRCVDAILELPEPVAEQPEPEPIHETPSLPHTEIPSVAENQEDPIAPSPILASQDKVAEDFSKKLDRLSAKKKKLDEIMQKKIQKLELKKLRQQAKQNKAPKNKKRELKEKPQRTISDPSLPSPSKWFVPTLSNYSPIPEPVMPPVYDVPPTISEARESQLLKIIADLQAENARVEEEKKNAMRWIINEMKTQLAEKEARQEDEVAQLKDQIRKLQDAFRESKSKENKLGKLLVNSKDVIVEGVCMLSKNVTEVTEKGWAKVQKELLNEEKEMKVLEKMKEFAHSLKDEINKVFQGEPQQLDVDQFEDVSDESDDSSDDEN